MARLWPQSLVVLGLLCAALAMGRGPTAQASPPGSGPGVKALVAPADGHTLVGVQLSWDVDAPASYTARSGLRPSQYGDYLQYPLTDADKRVLTDRVSAVKAAGADFVLTLEPAVSLSS